MFLFVATGENLFTLMYFSHVPFLVCLLVPVYSFPSGKNILINLFCFCFLFIVSMYSFALK